MSKKGTIEVFQTKISRNDRFAQMSHQEKLIEQKKREIQAKLEQKRASKETENVKSSSTKSSGTSTHKCPVKTSSTTDKNEKKAFNFNTFSNDGSFLNQFKQMKEKKLDHKSKSFSSKQGNDRDNDRNNKNKWKKEQTSPTISKDNRNQKSKPSRFNSETKISISTSYSNLITQQSFEAAVVTAQDVTGQPLLKNLVTQQQYPPNTTNVPIMMNVPPPQLQLHPLPPEITVDLCPTTVITTVALTQQGIVPETSTIITVPPPCLPPMELSSIPPPNPIQVHNIPQPEPMNTLTIPPPAPLQVQNIPPPSPIQLNEIPNPKSLDLLAIPTPNEEPDAEFIKNVPPPNKSVPPPSIADNVPTCLPPPNIMPPTSMPPPHAGMSLLVAQVPTQVTQIQLQQLPPPPAVVPLGTQPVPQPIMNPIPALMAQPILPPATMGIVPPPQINVPPPTMMQQTQIQLPPPSVFTQQALIPVNVPPPLIGLKDINAVFPPGSADYEAMASLGRMVAQCGPGIEDVVRQRKNQDPSLWFLFDKNSAAYRQYQQIVDQFKAEMSSMDGHRSDQDDYKPEEIYESDPGLDDCDMNDGSSQYAINKRKRKSRWGEKIAAVPPPKMAAPAMQTPILPSSTGVMLSKITRQDPGFINYVISTYGSTNVNEETWIKAEDNYKVHLVYQEMLKKKQDLERMQKTGRKKYDYDSDEEVDGGTWEHKQRESEMKTTQQWAQELTHHSEGKHHIGDFLPPDEFKKLFQKDPSAMDASDYSEHKLREDNKGFKMLQKLGWSEGKGLGTTEKGILEPINKGFVSRDGQGLGNQQDGGNNEGNGAEDEYDAYRKRMMLAYKFRPNPLNNPRRAYY